MDQQDKRIYFPFRNLVGALVPILIATWYFLDKAKYNVYIALVIIAADIGLLGLTVAVSSRTRVSQRPFFWVLYDFVTGNGRLPLRLFVCGMVVIVVLAIGFEVSGLKVDNPTSASFISRFVEVDTYWAVLNFVGLSDSTITPLGFSKVLTILNAFFGLMFWGMYISILINKYAEIQQSLKRKASDDDLDKVLFNETKPESEKTIQNDSLKKY